MTRILVSMLTLFAFMSFIPAFAGDTKGSAKCEASKCCKSTNCVNCAQMCEKMLEYCKKKGGKHADAKHINIMKDCITLCKACSDLSSRDSKLQAKLHAICAEACKKCAQSCAKLKDEKLKDCVDMCNTCATSCSEMSKKK